MHVADMDHISNAGVANSLMAKVEAAQMVEHANNVISALES